MSSYEDTWASLLTLRRVCEYYQFLMDEERAPLELLVNSTFPILEALM